MDKTTTFKCLNKYKVTSILIIYSSLVWFNCGNDFYMCIKFDVFFLNEFNQMWQTIRKICLCAVQLKCWRTSKLVSQWITSVLHGLSWSNEKRRLIWPLAINMAVDMNVLHWKMATFQVLLYLLCAAVDCSGWFIKLI